MTERGRDSLQRGRDDLAIGPSSLSWDRDGLTIKVDERTFPAAQRVRGTIRVEPAAINPQAFHLDRQGRHIWHPFAPRSRVTVDLNDPGLSWQGNGYFDMNRGDEPLEEGFTDWSWSRAHLQDETVIFYDAQGLDGTARNLALRFGEGGGCQAITPPPRADLDRGFWRVARPTRCEEGRPVLREVFEDAPFYTRSLIETTLFGQRVPSVHESLSLRRFANPVVRMMLPFRMPRRP